MSQEAVYVGTMLVKLGVLGGVTVAITMSIEYFNKIGINSIGKNKSKGGDLNELSDLGKQLRSKN